jgi:hypothetical protein
VLVQEPTNAHISQKFLPFTLPGAIHEYWFIEFGTFPAGIVTVLRGRHQADFWQIAEDLYN